MALATDDVIVSQTIAGQIYGSEWTLTLDSADASGGTVTVTGSLTQRELQGVAGPSIPNWEGTGSIGGTQQYSVSGADQFTIEFSGSGSAGDTVDIFFTANGGEDTVQVTAPAESAFDPSAVQVSSCNVTTREIQPGGTLGMEAVVQNNNTTDANGTVRFGLAGLSGFQATSSVTVASGGQTRVTGEIQMTQTRLDNLGFTGGTQSFDTQSDVVDVTAATAQTLGYRDGSGVRR